MSSAVERIDPTAIDERPTDTAMATMNSPPTPRRLMPRARVSSALRELSSNGRLIDDDDRQGERAETTTNGTVEASTVKIDPKRICCVAPVVAAVRRVEIEEQRRQTEGRPQDDARRQVTPTFSLHTDQVHRAGPDHPAPDEAEERAESEEEGGRAAGRRDVGEGVPGEGLAAHDDEDADDRRDDSRDRTDDQRRAHRGADEEAGFERTCTTSVERERRVLAAMSCSWPGSATTSTRPWSWSTSTWWP